MRRYLFALAAAFIASSASAQFQTTNTNCQFVFGTMQCTSTTPQQQQQPQNQVNWGLINSYPNPGKSFSDAYQRGLERRRMEEQQRLIAEQQRQLELQRQQMSRREQAWQNDPVVGSASTTAPSDMPLPPSGFTLDTPTTFATNSLSVEAGKMIAAGDCAGAKIFALNAGDLTLAKQVMDLCGN